MARQMRAIAARMLRIEPGEGRKTALMFGLLFCVVGFFIAGRIARDSLFLNRYSISYLPMMYVWVALGVGIQSYLYSRIADRYRHDKLMLVTLAIVLVIVASIRLLVDWAGPWLYPVIYVVVELAGTLLVIQTWTIANDIFNSREAKRLFGLVGGGGVIASVVVGFGVRNVVEFVGTPNLLVAGGLLLIPAMLMLAGLSSKHKPEFLGQPGRAVGATPTVIRIRNEWSRFWTNRQLLAIAVMVFILGASITLVDYQFKLAARQQYLDQERQLASFFGTFWAITGSFNCLIQFLVTGRLLERQGILFALLLLPTMLFGGSLAVLAAPGLLTATFMKGSEAVLRYTINDSATQLLYVAVPAHYRGRAKAFIDGLVRQLSVGATGALLALLVPSFPAPGMNWVLLLLCLMWISAAVVAHRHYYQSLFSSLRSRSFRLREAHAVIPDEALAKLVRNTIGQGEESVLLDLVEMVESREPGPWLEQMLPLLEHPSPRVRARTLSMLAKFPMLQYGPAVNKLLHDREPEVRAAAVEAYCAIGRDRAVPMITKLLADRNVDVQASAVAGLIRYGGLDGILSAAERLKIMLESTDPSRRRMGARVLGKIGVKNFYHPLLRLMVDEDNEVRLEAIKAAGEMRSKELLPMLVYRLEEPSCRAAASNALVGYGPEAVQLLSKVLENPHERLAIRLAVPAILARIGNQQAMDVLIGNLGNTAGKLATRLCEALHRLHKQQPHLRYPRKAVEQAFEREIRSCYVVMNRIDVLGLDKQSLLGEALLHQFDQGLKRAFLLLGLLKPLQAVDTVYHNLRNPLPRLRANAIELLDGMLEKRWKKLLLPLLDESHSGSRRQAARELLGIERQTPLHHLKRLLSSGHPWTVSCALWHIGEKRLVQLRDRVYEATASDEPMVRETALVALSKLDEAEKLLPILNRHGKDPDPKVARMARYLVLRLA